MKFKIGDGVEVIKKCTKNNCFEECEFIGDRGTIIAINNKDKTISVKNFENTNMWCSGFTEDCLNLVNKIGANVNTPLKLGKKVNKYKGLKKKDKIIVINNGVTYTTYNQMAKSLGATKWVNNTTPGQNTIGIIKQIRLYKGIYYFLININLQDYVIGYNGIQKYSQKYVSQINTIKVNVKIHKFFGKILNKSKYDEESMEEQEEFPECYLLGVNRKNVVIDLGKLRASYNLNGCGNMPSINASTMTKAMIKLLKRKRKVIGLVRIGNFGIDTTIGGDRGDSLNDIGSMNANSIIISYSRYGIRVESFDPHSKIVKNYTYTVVK